MRNLESVWEIITEYNRVHGIKTYTNMRLSMFCKESSPRKEVAQLKGSASEIRHFCTSLLEAWNHFMDNGIEWHRYVLLALKLNLRMDTILDNYVGEYKLPPDAADELEACVWNFNIVYLTLANYFAPRGGKISNQTYKCHGLIHACQMARYIHPRLAWCFGGEDMMGKSKVLAASCVKGNCPQSSQLKLASKYAAGLHFKLHDDIALV